MLRDPDAKFGTVFGTRAFEPRLEFVNGFVFGRAVGGDECEAKTAMSIGEQVGAWQSTLLRFDGDQAVGSLPLLIRILPVSDLQKMMIIDRGLFVVPQVVIGGGPQKKTDRGHLRI